MADLPPLPPRKTDQPRQLPERPAAASGRVDNRPGKPDPRPMRVVYGAGAVAVVSVMAVGLVQPDFSSGADQQATSDPQIADANVGQDGTSNGRSDQSGNGTTQPAAQVRHVIKYIHLKPGQTAPPGATVITRGQPTPRIVTANNPGPTQAPGRNNPPPVNNPPPKTNPPPVHQPPPPTPRPTTKTHQSGRP